MPQVQRRSLVDQVTSGLLSEIGSGRYPVGCLLPTEPHLAAQFKVSRTVLREAVSQLRAEGVIATVQGRGTYVTANQQPARISLTLVDERSAIKIVELRRGLEGEAAKLAAERRSEAHIAAMTTFLADMDTCLRTGDLEGLASADINFHREIFIASRNEYLLNIYNHIINLVQDSIKKSRRGSSERGLNPLPIQEEHARIFDAIVKKESGRALSAAREHMDFTAMRLAQRINPEAVDGAG